MSKAAEYEKWKQRFDEILTRTPNDVGAVLQVMAGAIDCVRNPDSIEERRMLVRTLVERSLVLVGPDARQAGIDGRREALQSLREAVAAAQALGESDGQSIYAAYHLGELVIGVDGPEAERWLRKALAGARALPDFDVPWRLRIEHTLALALMQQQRWPEAAAQLAATRQSWLERDREADLEAGLGAQPSAPLLHNLGFCWQRSGQLADARVVLAESLATARLALDESHPKVADTQLLLGQVLLELGQVDEAEPLLRQATSLVLEKAPMGHPLRQRASELQARLEAARRPPA